MSQPVKKVGGYAGNTPTSAAGSTNEPLCETATSTRRMVANGRRRPPAGGSKEVWAGPAGPGGCTHGHGSRSLRSRRRVSLDGGELRNHPRSVGIL